MIVDTSVIVAIALDEPERADLVAKIAAAESVGISAPTLVEAGIVLSARIGRDATELLSDLIASFDAVVVEFGALHWQAAVDAWRRFGRSRHPANLNFGDCLAYATASVAGDSLLAKGNDFRKTDITLA